MNVLIIGANGQIGRQVAQKMAQSDFFEPTAFIRKEEQKNYFDSIEVPSVVEDLTNQEEQIAQAMQGFDAVVFTAGSGGSTGHEKTLEIDLYGAIKSIHAAEQKGVKRFVMVSAAYADEPDIWEKTGIRPYYIAKHVADQELKRSDLAYTILRPVGLTNDDEPGKIQISKNPYDLQRTIPRIAVAEAILQVLQQEHTQNQILEMSSGDKEIADAVKSFG